MLRKLLELATGTGTLSTAELAERLRVPPALVGAMLEALARDGWLTDVVRKCAASCQSCPLQTRCLQGARPRIWSLNRLGVPRSRSGIRAAGD